MKKNYIFIICLFLLSVSCSKVERYDDAELFDFDTFVKIEELKGRMLEFDSMIMRPNGIRVYDSLLVLIEPRSEKLVHVFNLNTRKKIGSALSFGQGPDDMLQPKLMTNGSHTFQLFDRSSSRIFEYDMATFLESQNPKPMRRLKLSVPVFISAEQVGDCIWGYSHQVEHQLYVFDSGDGEKTGEIIGYPNNNISYTDTEKLDSYYMNFISNGMNKFAICYCMTDLIEFYDFNGNLHKRIHGPEQFFAHFKEYHDGKVISSSPDRETTRDAYFSPCNAGDCLMVMYDGGYVNDPDHTGLCSWIFSFSWNGVPNIAYKLDNPLLFMTVDSQHRKIYGISNAPEYHIVEYSY